MGALVTRIPRRGARAPCTWQRSTATEPRLPSCAVRFGGAVRLGWTDTLRSCRSPPVLAHQSFPPRPGPSLRQRSLPTPSPSLGCALPPPSGPLYRCAVMNGSAVTWLTVAPISGAPVDHYLVHWREESFQPQRLGVSGVQVTHLDPDARHAPGSPLELSGWTSMQHQAEELTLFELSPATWYAAYVQAHSVAGFSRPSQLLRACTTRAYGYARRDWRGGRGPTPMPAHTPTHPTPHRSIPPGYAQPPSLLWCHRVYPGYGFRASARQWRLHEARAAPVPHRGARARRH